MIRCLDWTSTCRRPITRSSTRTWTSPDLPGSFPIRRQLPPSSPWPCISSNGFKTAGSVSIFHLKSILHGFYFNKFLSIHFLISFVILKVIFLLPSVKCKKVRFRKASKLFLATLWQFL